MLHEIPGPDNLGLYSAMAIAATFSAPCWALAAWWLLG